MCAFVAVAFNSIRREINKDKRTFSSLQKMKKKILKNLRVYNTYENVCLPKLNALA